MVFEPNDSFNHTRQIKRPDAIAESKNMGADYCLLLTLGEFRDHAQMTFLKDYVILESGVLLDVNTKREVWVLNEPYKLYRTNVGHKNYLGKIDDIAKVVAESIVKGD